MELCTFDELGRYQFELLCREILGPDADWREHNVAVVDGVSFTPAPPGPVLVLVAWIPPHTTIAPDGLLADLVRPWRHSLDSMVVVTNIVAEQLDVPVVDAAVLSQLVQDDAALRLRMPSLLAIVDPSLFDDALVARSTADVEGAQALARVFVPTRGYGAAVARLSRFGFTALTGPPEMGKTAIARMVGLAQLSNGWEFHECVRPEQLWDAYERDRPQVFVADDAFGATEYRPDAAERWAIELDRVLHAMDDRHWLLWTSRPAPLKAGLRRIHREHGVERFPQPAEVQVDATALELTEKALMLYRHARTAALPRAVLDGIRIHGWSIVAHEHFTPERIRRFVGFDAVRTAQSHDELLLLVDNGIREPTDAMSASFRALDAEHRALLVALLDVPTTGPVSQHDLAAAARRHSGSFGHRPDVLIDRLTDHFVRVLDAGAVAWVHPSWRDLVIDELAEDRVLRHAFLGAASIDGFLLALSLHGGGSGQRSLPLLVHDEDWDALADRLSELADDLDEPSMTRLFVGLVEALETIRDHRARELRAFAIYALQLAARIWDRRKAHIPLGLLERWFDVRRRVGEPIEAPHLARTWVEALPLPEDVDLESATFHDDLRDWLGLVELLNDQEPGVLAELGFPQVAEPFVNIIASESGIVDPHVFLLLGRLADVLPAYDDAIRTMHRIRASAEVETYVPRELSAEMQDLLDAPPIAVQSGEATVRRVLRDL